jgi:translation elongation factor EF-Tu-like GTPase
MRSRPAFVLAMLVLGWAVAFTGCARNSSTDSNTSTGGAPVSGKQASFQMTVDDVFSITGQGIVVTGQIERGTLKTGDEIYVRHAANVTKTAAERIEASRQVLPEAHRGEAVGVLLRGIEKGQVEKGDVLVDVP